MPVTFAFGLRRRVFCVSLVDEGAPAALSEDLHVALGRALGLEADDPWIARTSRELAGELTQQP